MNRKTNAEEGVESYDGILVDGVEHSTLSS